MFPSLSLFKKKFPTKKSGLLTIYLHLNWSTLLQFKTECNYKLSSSVCLTCDFVDFVDYINYAYFGKIKIVSGVTTVVIVWLVYLQLPV